MLSPEISELFPRRLAAIVRWHDKDQATQAALVAAEAGIGSVEITAATPGAFELIRQLRDHPRATACAIGAGTLTDSELARRAVDAGAQYLVTPYLVPAVAEVAARSGVPLVMGALTPTEIARALELGAQLVKVFPVAPVGGPAYIRALRGPMPQPPIWVSGGATIEDCEDYLRAGTDVVGLTNDLFRPELLMAEDWIGLAALCELALAAARRAEPIRTTATV
ncbi:MAG: bifunctional 4-hydroxy-2-oxoglutarate aldolase/2-dehydro-3-deoxy-phosphogluconate aldolase [Acidimicrobiales bacterium]|jgi:2-dehydro-3-deoxyphosphogluconate aldolase/(4S)-4-hydroxy-2-oxoglutarate aldolase